MAKNLTTFVSGIGSSSGASSDRVWDFGNERVDARACGGSPEQNQIAWCVPPGVSTARFELWGAGGLSGGASSCCGIAAPSSAGAYAYKTVSVTPGDCYLVYAGISYCAGECRDGTAKHIAEFGGTGCPQLFHTYVLGTGLTNFCAEKGNNSCYITCGDYDATVTGVDSDTTFLWNDSENAPQACYYGADGGHRGWNGYTFASPEGNPAVAGGGNYCTWKFAVPYPAGLITKRPGRWTDQMCCNQSNCVQGGFARTFGYNGGCKGAFMAGAGSAPVITCGGSNRCGVNNVPGRVKITYS